MRSDCNLRYPYDGKVGDGPLFLASQMEDKWDIYLYDGVLYFARSWTGELLARAHIAFTNVASVISIEAVHIPTGVERGTPYQVRLVDFLMKRHLYNLVVPHPLHRDLPYDPLAIAGFSMTMFGRWAHFASFEDTTIFDPWAASN